MRNVWTDGDKDVCEQQRYSLKDLAIDEKLDIQDLKDETTKSVVTDKLKRLVQT